MSDDILELMKYGIYELLLCSIYHAMNKTQSLPLKSANLGEELYQVQSIIQYNTIYNI